MRIKNAEWRLLKLGDIFKISSGGTPLKRKLEYYENGTIRWVCTGDLKNKYITKVKGLITEEALNNSSAKLFPANTVLIAMYGATIGACSILTVEAATNQACAAFLPTKEVDSSFFYYFLRSKKDDFVKMGVGGAQPNISATILKSVKIPLPPLEAQKQIAQTLDTAAELLDMRKQQLAELDNLIKFTFYDMFGDPVKNEKGWPVIPCKDNVDILTGYPFKSAEYVDEKTQLKLCGGLIIMPDKIDWKKCNYWPKLKAEGIKKYELTENDIVLAMDRPWISNGLKIAMINKSDLPSLLVQRTARLRGINIDQYFLYYVFKDRSFAIHCKPTETTVPHISINDINSFDLISPPISLQTHFAEIVTKIEEQKALVKKAIDETQSLFNSLMAEYFE